MIQFVKSPNIPNRKVKTVICGTTDEILLNYTKSFGIEIIQSKINNSVDSRIAEHTDLSVHHLGNNEILIDYSQKELKEHLEQIGMKVTVCGNSQNKIKTYPEDCALNCARLGNRMFANKNSIEQNLVNYINSNEIELIYVKQGYSKCSILIIDEDTFITDDESIFKQGLINSFNCIKINKGSVKLNGFDYGFIGGCGGLIDKKHLIFFGDITKHTNYEQIKVFLKDNSCKFDYLKDYPLTDIGGFIPLTEENS